MIENTFIHDVALRLECVLFGFGDVNERCPAPSCFEVRPFKSYNSVANTHWGENSSYVVYNTLTLKKHSRIFTNMKNAISKFSHRGPDDDKYVYIGNLVFTQKCVPILLNLECKCAIFYVEETDTTG